MHLVMKGDKMFQYMETHLPLPRRAEVRRTLLYSFQCSGDRRPHLTCSWLCEPCLSRDLSSRERGTRKLGLVAIQILMQWLPRSSATRIVPCSNTVVDPCGVSRPVAGVVRKRRDKCPLEQQRKRGRR
jgi:hypothetical protein